MLKRIRTWLAVGFFIAVTALFLDFTGSVHAWLGWTAKVQLLPAILAVNMVVVAALLLLTLLFGRVYCSVICPLGVYQDVISHLAARRKRNRFRYSPALSWLRYGVFAVFVVCLLAGVNAVVSLLAPYSSWGRIASNLLAPFYAWGNNLLANWAEHVDSYAFYSTEVWLKSGIVLGTALLTVTVISILAWRGGRTYCNTVCPVGTLLGFVSRYSLFRVRIDTSRCNGCQACARNCKASCINAAEHRIDYSRCVACMDCVEKCRQHAITYTWRRAPKTVAEPVSATGKPVDGARRAFLSGTAMALGTAAVQAQMKTVDGGLAAIEEKKVPRRNTPVTPPGTFSARHLAQHCTACQLCISVCPNQVLRPSQQLETLMQPESSFERGYCRPECTRCSEVCPTGAITKITPADKSAIHVGKAVWLKENCVVLTDGVKCGNCARHCPTGAITMVPSDPDVKDSPKVPVVNIERCIGCGACEALCPARPFSAIYVEGYEQHRDERRI